MANLVVLLIIAGCVAYQYLKGTFFKAFVTIIIAICAGTVAFGYFELLANVFISRGSRSQFPALVPWAQALSFTLLAVLVFAVLQTIASKLIRSPFEFGALPERIGRGVCGFFLGLIVSGLVMTTLAMAPLSNKYPYQRFDPSDPVAEDSSKVFLAVDDFVTEWFSLMSRGSFSGKKSFAALHPDFLDQVFLNRHSIGDKIPIVSHPSSTIDIPKENAAWPAPDGLKDSDTDRPIEPKNKHHLIFVRVGIEQSAFEDAGEFTLSQIRLICKKQGNFKNPFAGKGENIYPIGYLKTVGRVQVKRLNEVIKLKRNDFTGRVKWIDFAFNVPDGFVPVRVGFKQNCIAEVPKLVSADQAPVPEPFSKPKPSEDEKKTEETMSAGQVDKAVEKQPPKKKAGL